LSLHIFKHFPEDACGFSVVEGSLLFSCTERKSSACREDWQ
jgi:hypothetical protein